MLAVVVAVCAKIDSCSLPPLLFVLAVVVAVCAKNDSCSLPPLMFVLAVIVAVCAKVIPAVCHPCCLC